MNTLIDLINVSRTHDSSSRPALDGVSLRIPAGEVTTIMGPSGSGKSTPLNLVASLDRATSGSIGIEGQQTIRFYDPKIAAWRSTWIDPLNGRVRRFIGRPVGDLIVLEGLDEDPRERWMFSTITPDSFTWRNEEFTDGGQTWALNDQMYATRRRAE